MPPVTATTPPLARVLRAAHRASAVPLLAFAALHLANHLLALRGVAAHIGFMEAARAIYRLPLVEVLLLACVGIQMASGAGFAWLGRHTRRGFFAWTHAVSGIFLAAFLAIHVTAVLFARAWLGLDTNFHFAAAGLHTPPNHLFFAPYYFVAVSALAVHLACVLCRRLPAGRRAAAFVFVTLAGAAAALVIVLCLAGIATPVEIPVRYRATFAAPGG